VRKGGLPFRHARYAQQAPPMGGMAAMQADYVNARRRDSTTLTT